MNIRDFLIAALLLVCSGLLMTPLSFAMEASPSAYPFTLGIASGDVTDSAVVLWTRLAPEPLEADGGMPPDAVPVRWELALDPQMSRVVRRGEAMATPVFAHSVHVELDGLDPGREYWYRFFASTHESPVGRT